MIGHEMIGEWSNHLWQSTLFAVAAALVTLAFRKNRAHVRYWVWLSASVKFLIPFALLMNLGNSLWTAFAAKKIAAEFAPPTLSLTVQQIAQPFPQTSPLAPAASLTHTADWILIAIFSTWVCGFLGVALARFRGWLRIRAAMRASTPIDIQAAVAVRSSLGLFEPGVVGVLRPVLLLPEGILERLSPSQLEAVIAHELSHIRRRDNLTAAIHMIVEAVFWFHPFVWWIGARLVEERECACDEAVLSLGGEPRDYADAIVSVCKLYVESPLACVSGISGSDLKKRIVRIMARHVGLNMSLGKKFLLLAVALVAIAVPVVLGQAKAAQRLMLAVVKTAPKPLQTAAHAMMAVEETPSTGSTAEAQAIGADAPATAPAIKFDVASIKPIAPGEVATGWGFAPDELEVNGASPVALLAYVYQLQIVQERIVGGPDWARTQGYDIHAKVALEDVAAYAALSRDPTPHGDAQRRAMLRVLIEERFHLKAHMETRQGPIYDLVVAKGGPKLKTSAPSQAPYITMHSRQQLEVHGTEIGALVPFFAQQLGHTVVDKTGLPGKYDMTLDWQADAGASAAVDASDPSKPSLFTAVEEQLGLKLVPSKGPVPVLVIDHIEKPTVDGAEVPESSPAQSQPQNTATPSPSYEYEVATIKPSQGPGPYKKIGLWAAPDGFNAWFITPQQIISIAYGVESFQFSGGPSWLPSERFDIQAKMDAATTEALAKLSQTQRVLAQQQMLQALLANRFQLTVHRETKEGPIYTLVIAKGGPKLQEAKPGDPGADNMTSKSSGYLTAQAVPIARLVRNLTQMLGHPVLDKTELKGVYDFKLQFTPDDRLQPTSPLAPNATLPEPPADSNAPSLFDALQEQLGLKLESGKGPVEVIVIDHVERPTGN